MQHELFHCVKRVIKREFLLSYRKQSELLYPLLFFLMVITLFPLAVTPDPQLLAFLACGIMWVAVLLAVLLSVNQLFHEDFFDGSLEQWFLGPLPPSIIVFIKLFVRLLFLIVPLLVLLPYLGLLFHVSFVNMRYLAVSLLLATPSLVFLGGIGAALTVGLRNSALLLALVLLPFDIPILIFSSHLPQLLVHGGNSGAVMALLGALLIITVVLGPLISVFALRLGVAYD